MQAHQKSMKDGIQNILFPVEHMNITQGNNGSYSHQGVNALDLAGYKGGCSPLYAPFDVTVSALMDRIWEMQYSGSLRIRFALRMEQWTMLRL